MLLCCKNIQIGIWILLVQFVPAFCPPSILAQNREIKIEKITAADGLSHKSVMGITQDKFGFMWFSTYTGIDRFDGYEFKNYATANLGIKDRYYFTDIMSDRKGQVWFCDATRRVSKYVDTLDRFLTYGVRNDRQNAGQEKLFFDHLNNLWIATGTGIVFLKEGADPDKELRHENFGFTELDTLKTHTIAEDLNGNIWLGCPVGLYMLKMTGNKLSGLFRYRFTGDKFIEDNPNEVMTIQIDKNNHLWAGTYSDGLKEIDLSDPMIGKRSGRIKHKAYFKSDSPYGSIRGNGIIYMIPDGKGNLFLKTSKGIDLFNTTTGTSESLCKEGAVNIFDSDEGWIMSSMYFSHDSILWAGTNEGAYKIIIRNNPFTTINNFSPDKNGLQPLKSDNVLVDRNDRLWVGTPGNGIHLGIKNEKDVYSFTRYTKDSLNLEKSVFFEKICCLTEAPSGNIWVSGGFFQQAKGSGSDISFIRKRLTPFPQCVYISTTTVNQILERNNKLWVLYQISGIKIYDTISWEEKTLRIKETEELYYPYVAFADNRRIFLRDEPGFYEISGGLLEKGDFLIPIKTDTLLNQIIPNMTGKFIVVPGRNGYWFWIPSINDGVFRYFLPDEIKDGKKQLVLSDHFNTRTGLSNNNVYDLIQDKNGNIWISTANGLNMINPQTAVIRSYYTSDGLPDNTFNYGVSKDRSEFLYFCSVKGVVKFHPDSLLISNKIDNIYLTEIKLLNKENSGFQWIDLGSSVKGIETLRLKYNQNFLSFGFRAIDYMNREKTQYRYCMDGIGSGWIIAGTKPLAEYQNLKPGKYTFRVQASQKNGAWSDAEASIRIEIIPPFWQKIWFLGLLLSSFSAAIVLFIRKREKNLIRRNVLLENQVKEKTEQAIRQRLDLEEMKSRFYTNISHEFRTPLTLINNSAREIEKQTDKGSVQGFTSTILKSGDRLLKLVNELLDLSRIEAGKLELRVSEGDLSALVKLVWQTYISDAERRNLEYLFESEEESGLCWFDKEFMNKILHNLISNALKFTPSGGRVTIETKIVRNDLDNNILPVPFASIVISDTGKGIQKEHLPKIFDRFYQTDNSNTREHEGTGIGLSIVNELVTRHYGKIRVDSTPEKGSSFYVDIPVGRDRFRDTELLKETDNEIIVQQDRAENNIYSPRKRKYNIASVEKPLVLIAEDNDDLRDFLSYKLLESFRVIEAVNGNEALEKALEHGPDIIISDIMMPGSDGIELCENIRNHVAISHVPIILLTAKADLESKIEGLRTGADDYLTKPFNEEELFVRIENLLHQRQILKTRFLSSPLTELPGLRGQGSDKDFIDRLLAVIEKNFMNSDFSIADFSDSMHVSIRTLQRKIKDYCGLSPVEFIRFVKVKHAAVLLSEQKIPVSEAAYRTGFSSLSYFSKVFKEVMGVAASEYTQFHPKQDLK